MSICKKVLLLFLGPDGGFDLEEEGKTFYGMDTISFEDNYPQQLEGSGRPYKSEKGWI